VFPLPQPATGRVPAKARAVVVDVPQTGRVCRRDGIGHLGREIAFRRDELKRGCSHIDKLGARSAVTSRIAGHDIGAPGQTVSTTQVS